MRVLSSSSDFIASFGLSSSEEIHTIFPIEEMRTIFNLLSIRYFERMIHIFAIADGIADSMFIIIPMHVFLGDLEIELMVAIQKVLSKTSIPIQNFIFLFLEFFLSIRLIEDTIVLIP